MSEEEKSFQKYLIKVGMRSVDYTYSDADIFDNIEFFRKCQKAELSAYKALLFLGQYLSGDEFDFDWNIGESDKTK